VPTANGISDDWENTYLGGTNAALGGAMEDRDGDGFSNLHEYIAGTNPTNAASLLKLGSRLGLTTGQPHPGLRPQRTEGLTGLRTVCFRGRTVF